MEIEYKPKALADRDLFKKSGNKSLQKKIQDLINEIEKHPKIGTGKPEPLKYELSSYWSLINYELRITKTSNGHRH
ncbi:MAG: type II toxin-antitoxin system YoeB family toxin [Bacteroidales bacterium]|jgi:toxin YoeB|nr:type II toxin-antitoxin system YoeB family toxin [Bacteroidales bacterium]